MKQMTSPINQIQPNNPKQTKAWVTPIVKEYEISKNTLNGGLRGAEGQSGKGRRAS